jgi:hypothetical protein
MGKDHFVHRLVTSVSDSFQKFQADFRMLQLRPTHMAGVRSGYTHQGSCSQNSGKEREINCDWIWVLQQRNRINQCLHSYPPSTDCFVLTALHKWGKSFVASALMKLSLQTTLIDLTYMDYRNKQTKNPAPHQSKLQKISQGGWGQSTFSATRKKYLHF